QMLAAVPVSFGQRPAPPHVRLRHRALRPSRGGLLHSSDEAGWLAQSLPWLHGFGVSRPAMCRGCSGGPASRASNGLLLESVRLLPGGVSGGPTPLQDCFGPHSTLAGRGRRLPDG